MNKGIGEISLLPRNTEDRRQKSEASVCRGREIDIFIFWKCLDVIELFLFILLFCKIIC